MGRYPENIMKKLRLRAGLEENDTSKDKKLESYAPNIVFKEVLNWEGLINYDYAIRSWIEDIYGVNISDISEK